MRRMMWALALTVGLGACDADDLLVVVDEPAAPRNLTAFYYGGSVTVVWELAPSWNGEPFRVYAKRLSDADFTFIAEVTSCAEGTCSYEDRNIVAQQTYEYYVAAVDPGSGVETPAEFSVEVEVPDFTPPPVPTGLEVVALDGANYLRWSDASRSASDFSFYRVYQSAGDVSEFLLGETDSEGFLDELAANGETFTYFVTAVDEFGHESPASGVASGTPRPDFRGEWLYAFGDDPGASGFRFQEDERANPIVNGASAQRHFRLEVDGSGWWLVPGPGTAVYPEGFSATALRCGPGSDATCTDVRRAPSSGYVVQDLGVDPQTSYVLRVEGDDGQTHYGVIWVQLLGFDQNDDAIMIFDWAYQTQPGNPDLAPPR